MATPALLVAPLAALLFAPPRATDLSSAMDGVRKGRYEEATKLSLGAADVPALSSFLSDRDEAVRREAVGLLGRVGGIEACSALAKPLVDASADVRERGARTLHARCPAASTSTVAGLDAALRSSVEAGNAAAGALLLLGRFPTATNRDFLSLRVSKGDAPVKLEPWSPPVPSSLAAAVAAASTGLASARSRVRQGLGPPAEAEFLASVLGDLADAESLALLFPLLEDLRASSRGAPSGGEPRRRICDLAVDGFVARLGLAPSFPLRKNGSYTPAELEEVRRLASASVSSKGGSAARPAPEVPATSSSGAPSRS